MAINKTQDEVMNYLNGKLSIKDSSFTDLSYDNWVSKDSNLQKLCTEFEVSKKEANLTEEENKNNKDLFYQKILNLHDHTCELQLIKWITDDEEHRNRLYKFPNTTKVKHHSDDLPYEYNVVRVNSNDNKTTQAINASYICGPSFEKGNHLFIAAQAPKDEEKFTFWKMVLQQDIDIIIILSSPEESNSFAKYSKEKIVDIIKDPNTGEEIKIMVKDSLEFITHSFMKVETIINNNKPITQIHVMQWPSHSVPDIRMSSEIISFIFEEIETCRKTHQDKENHILIVSPSSFGRIGTLIAIYNILKCESNLMRIKNEQKRDVVPMLNVFNVVRKLREQRYSMITEEEQYTFIYQFCLNWIKKNFFK